MERTTWTALLAVPLLAVGAAAGTATWIDATPGGATWHDDGNWNPAQPGPGDTAVLANGGKAIATADVTIENIQLRSGSTWRVESGDTLVSITGHDKVKLADSGGVSYMEMTGGSVEFLAGAMHVGYGNGNAFHGRFSGGTLIHRQAPGAYADLRLASSGTSAFDIELSGIAVWDMGAVSIGYHTSVPEPSTFVVRDSAQMNLTSTLLIDDSTQFTLRDSASITAGSNGIAVNGAGAEKSVFTMLGGTIDSTRLTAGDDGRIVIEAGTVTTGQMSATGGDPVIAIRGGTVTVSTHIALGLGSVGDMGTLEVTNGATLNVVAGKPVYVSRYGDGRLMLGDATSAGTILNGNLTFDDQNRGGQGLVQGHGQLGVQSIRFYGAGTHKIVADGYGSDRTLTVAALVTTHSRPDEDTDSGWYAQNGGKLALPALTVTAGTSTHYWGELASVGRPDLVNSVMLQFNGVAGGSLPISLLAPDRSELADTVAAGAVGFWQFDGSAFDFGAGTVDLTFRYDAAAAGAGEGELKLYKTDADGNWTLLAYTLDTVNDVISVTGVDAFSLFGVGEEIANQQPGGPDLIPEPATLALLSLGCLPLLRRRRTR